MSSSRRDFIQKTSLTSLAALMGLSACESNQKTANGRIGSTENLWDRHPGAPQPLGSSPYQTRPTPQPSYSARSSINRSTKTVLGVPVIGRSDWTRSQPLPGKTNPMNGINRVTVHHAGMDVVTITDAAWSKQHVEFLRNSHVKGRGWGDIGYHLIIDRAGRVYEGRPANRQGAHVKNHNEHNLGILVIGNFERQTPSSQQVESLANTMKTLSRTLKISRRRFHTHREFNPTACPGRHLQPRIDSIRTRQMA